MHEANQTGGEAVNGGEAQDKPLSKAPCSEESENINAPIVGSVLKGERQDNQLSLPVQSFTFTYIFLSLA